MWNLIFVDCKGLVIVFIRFYYLGNVGYLQGIAAELYNFWSLEKKRVAVLIKYFL